MPFFLTSVLSSFGETPFVVPRRLQNPTFSANFALLVPALFCFLLAKPQHLTPKKSLTLRVILKTTEIKRRKPLTKI